MRPGESEINKLEGNTNKELKQHYINIFNGDISDPIYSEVKHITDVLKEQNQHICDIVILNSAAAEGITLKEVRHVVLYHAPSDMSKIYQIIGRAVRNCTHTKLPEEERTVMPVLFVNKNIDPNNESTEETHFNKLVNVSETFVPYLNALKETAIDCKLNSEITKPDGTLLYPELLRDPTTLTCLVK
jgi:type I site-specific restriction endonuclease